MSGELPTLDIDERYELWVRRALHEASWKVDGREERYALGPKLIERVARMLHDLSVCFPRAGELGQFRQAEEIAAAHASRLKPEAALELIEDSPRLLWIFGPREMQPVVTCPADALTASLEVVMRWCAGWYMDELADGRIDLT